MDKYSVGIDLGGTKIAVGLCKKEEIVNKVTIPTDAKKGTEHVLSTIANAAIQAIGDTPKDQIKGVGIGAAGQINPHNGEVIYSPNLNWENIGLGDFLHKKLGLPVKVLNDVRAATLAEYKFGNGKNHKNFINIFVGTGVGSGFVINGDLVHGATNSAGEIGHICMDPQGPQCGCGKLGCLEAYASGTGMENYVKAQLKDGRKSCLLELAENDISNITGPIIGEGAKANDELALEAIERVGTYLGIALANLHNFVNPETILLGGGMMALQDYFMPKLMENMNKFILPVAGKNESLIKEAKFTNDAVLLGGSAIFS